MVQSSIENFIVKVAFIESLTYVDFVDKTCVFGVVEILIGVDFCCFCKTNQRGENECGYDYWVIALICLVCLCGLVCLVCSCGQSCQSSLDCCIVVLIWFSMMSFILS